MTKIYSPSATLAFQRCPTLWSYHRQGYRTKAIGVPNVAAAIGIGISRGMELLYSHASVGDAVTTAIETAHKEVYDVIETHSGYVLPNAERNLEEMPRRIEKAIKGFVKQKPLPEDWHRFSTEVTFPDYGHCRADILCQSDLGPCIVDWKTKVTAQDYIIDRFLQDMETSWQLYHYVWAARCMGMDVQSFAVCLMVIEPLHFYVEQWIVDEQYMTQWVYDAHQWWRQMEEIETLSYTPHRVGVHRDQYGLCSHYGMCYDSPQVSEMTYYRKERVYV